MAKGKKKIKINQPQRRPASQEKPAPRPKPTKGRPTAKPTPKSNRPRPNVARPGEKKSKNNIYAYHTDFLFERNNFIYMLAGAGLLILGLLLMSGGKMPSPDVWDDSLIYSFRRITLAPAVMLVGLGLLIAAIFKR